MSAVPFESLRRIDAARVGAKAAHLGELLSAGFPVPPGVVVPAGADAARAAGEAAAALGPVPVAVRSSALAEDLAEASFAGQYESYLQIEGAAAIADAIARCRASGSADRVAAYKRARGDGGDDAVAVVVQRMVPAKAAGVAFSADPITGRRDAVRVSAVAGLGERLVSGQADADEWIADGDGVRALRHEGAIDADLVGEIAGIARRVEAHFGAPIDIEWAWDGDRVWLVQARPITALPDPVSWEAPPGAWSRAFRMGEWLGGPVTPLGASWLIPRLEDRLFARYFELGGAERPARTHAFLNGWYYGTLDFAPTAPGPILRFLVRLPHRLLKDWRSVVMLVPPLAKYGVERQVTRWETEIAPAYRAAVADAAHWVDDAPVDALPGHVDGLIDLAGDCFTWITLVGGYAWKAELPLAAFYRDKLQPTLGGSHQELLVGFGAPELPPHAVESLDWAHPTLGERGGIGTDPDAPARRARLTARSREALDRALSALPDADRPQLEALVATARRFSALREVQVAELTLAWPVLRRALGRIGAALVARGAIGAPDDVYFLVRDELSAALSAPAPIDVAPRRATWERQRRLVPPLVIGTIPSMLQQMFDELESLRAGTVTGEVVARGLPASPGQATGRVRILRDPADFDRLGPGDVLVASATTPVWTPLFARAAAVVTDNGSPVAHASLVAREYGIPAVVGTGDGTQRLSDGQIVTVDGSAGVVVAR